MKFDFDEVVVGASFAAVYFAFTNGIPIIYQIKKRPFYGDMIGDINKADYYDYMLSVMSISNLNLFGDKVADIRIENNTITVSGKKPWIAEVKANKIHNFLSEESKKCVVVDYINVRSCGPHSFRTLEDPSRNNFVKELQFYPSERNRKSKNFLFNFKEKKAPYEKIDKDVRAISFLFKKDLEKEEFGPTYSVIKAKKIMKDAGLRGRKKGFERRPGKKFEQRYGPLDLEFGKREIYSVDDKEYVFTLESKNEYIEAFIDIVYDGKRRSKQQKNQI